MTLAQLQQQLADTENEYESAKATVYRIDGALHMLRHVIAKTEETTPAAVPEE